MLLTVILEASAAASLGRFGIAISSAIIIIGAGIGIGGIGQKAMDAIARQPEAANSIRMNMILSAALIEGLAFFALIVCLIGYFV
ncbi:MAG: ATP synthase F0 subunit C [Bacteroidales bacterium]|jgi:F-type H+-transporting ATPase subunit c|nr:ATP synthase F0 subunit C [Bacteroidales bacterium]MCI2122237.1 ATP synthase F0 subunit C [Bacteroidales bacterium]MCI2144797.1 ATP synthase F0 subunit C [Bacteroidales bacterium]